MSLKSHLSNFSSHLQKSSEEISSKGAEAAILIFNFLRKNRNDVKRYVLAGSLGANLRSNGNVSSSEDATTLPDFDLVIFLQNQNPPFQQVLIEFADAFSKNLDITIVNAFHSQYIGITINGLKFHVFPAIDLTDSKGVQNEEQIAIVQRKNTLSAIQRSPSIVSAGRMYSSSLAESAIQFVTNQSDFTHAIIRLAKFWVRHVHLDEELQIHGSPYLMECLAVYVSSKTSKNDLLDAFTHFLALVTNFSKVRIVFPPARIPECFKGYKGPLVLDPVNPYNNLAIFRSESALQEEIVSCIQTAGMMTLWKLEAAKSENIRISSMEDLATLFPQKKTESLMKQTRQRLQGTPPRRPWRILVWILVVILTPFVLIRAFCRFLGRRIDLVAMFLLISFACYFIVYTN